MWSQRGARARTRTRTCCWPRSAGAVAWAWRRLSSRSRGGQKTYPASPRSRRGSPYKEIVFVLYFTISATTLGHTFPQKNRFQYLQSCNPPVLCERPPFIIILETTFLLSYFDQIWVPNNTKASPCRNGFPRTHISSTVRID